MDAFNSIFQDLRKIFRQTQFSPLCFVVPAILSVIVALLDGTIMASLMPLLKGIIYSDFTFVRDIPVLSDIIDCFPHLFARPNSPIFIFLVVTIFFLSVFKNILSFFANILADYRLQEFADRLRTLIFSRYLKFGKLFYDRNSQGQLHTVLIRYSQSISANLGELPNILIGICTFCTYFVIMFIISWKLTLFTIVIFPALHYSIGRLVKKIKTLSLKSTEAVNNLSRSMFNSLSCMMLVKLYTNQKEEHRQFSKMSRRVSLLQHSINKRNYLVPPIQDTILLMAMLLLISFMAYLIIRAKSGEITSFLVYFYLLRRSVGYFGILNRIRIITAGIAGPLAEIMKMLDDKEKFIEVNGDVEFPGLRNKIEFKNLSFSYSKNVPVLHDVSFEIERGKMTAIVGPTGSGKTTITNLLVRLYEAEADSILVDGVDIRKFTLESLRSHIAVVTQDVLLFNDSLYNNLVYGLNESISEDEVIEACKQAEIYEFICSLPKGLATIIGDRGMQLSGGEKQRISIARAILKKTEILILDEATSSLDTITEGLIQRALDRAVQGKTSIVIAHRLSTIRNADKIVVLKQGHFVEQGQLQQLIDKQGEFYKYWQEQKMPMTDDRISVNVG